MNKLFQSFSWASNGLKSAWVEEKNFRIEVSIAILVIILGLLKDISKVEWVFIFIAITMVLSSEIINTAIEDICNKIDPSINPVIGKIKDLMAGFVLISCIGATIIGILVFF